jgi:hypothetical protein
VTLAYKFNATKDKSIDGKKDKAIHGKKDKSIVLRRARGGVLIIWLTCGPAMFVLALARSSAPISWFVGLAVSLVAYIEFYWLWVAIQSGWHLNKEGRKSAG